MDNKSPSKESKEVTRESLIAISNSLPDKTLESTSALESKKSDGRKDLRFTNFKNLIKNIAGGFSE